MHSFLKASGGDVNRNEDIKVSENPFFLESNERTGKNLSRKSPFSEHWKLTKGSQQSGEHKLKNLSSNRETTAF